MTLRLRHAGTIGVVAAALLTAGNASAQEPSTASKKDAAAALAEGRKLLASGRVDEACEKFAESQRFDARRTTYPFRPMQPDGMARMRQEAARA